MEKQMVYSETGRYSGRGGSGMYRSVAGLTVAEKSAVAAGTIVVIDHDCPTGNRELPVRYVIKFGQKFAPRSFTDRKQAEAALRICGRDVSEFENKLARLA